MAKVVEYLENDLAIQEGALKDFEPNLSDQDSEIRIMREKEAIRLYNQIMELKRHIAVIKLISA